MRIDGETESGEEEQVRQRGDVMRKGSWKKRMQSKGQVNHRGKVIPEDKKANGNSGYIV